MGPYEVALPTPVVRPQAQKMFAEEWAKPSDSDGMTRDVDGVFVSLDTKAQSKRKANLRRWKH